MNLNPLLSRFMDLVEYDQTVHTIENEIDLLLDQIFVLEEAQKRVLALIQKEHELVRELKKSVDTHELQMKILDGKASAAKAKLSTASNGREYEILKKEFDSASQDQNNFEDILLNAWALFESAQKILVQKEAAFQEQKVLSQQEIIEKNQKKEVLDATLNEKQHERLEKQQALPEQWVADYLRMRGSVSNPVVHLENGACSACFESLACHEIAQLERKQLAPCGGCYRFLFIKP